MGAHLLDAETRSLEFKKAFFEAYPQAKIWAKQQFQGYNQEEAEPGTAESVKELRSVVKALYGYIEKHDKILANLERRLSTYESAHVDNLINNG